MLPFLSVNAYLRVRFTSVKDNYFCDVDERHKGNCF